MALGKEWSIGKVKDRLREERGHLLSDASRYTSLFLLSTTGNDTMTRLADTSKVSSAGIKDGSVLWWTPSAEGNAELQAEVDRLKGLKGKEGAELKMNMMKKCAVM
ncbi:hypothetical protein ADEAN_000467100 [Angomonas deanei]|uniref:Uncharacterized protein n=1 Tax=Angomonas deanei TaxID=59799 RepID=A0A7G2CET2_9TRYP|nr:hypothetical protein ADEAN_000467100 [Angomonas deanei]